MLENHKSKKYDNIQAGFIGMTMFTWQLIIFAICNIIFHISYVVPLQSWPCASLEESSSSSDGLEVQCVPIFVLEYYI